MEIKFGLISVDSHAQMGKDNWTDRMSKSKWGDRIPHLIETTDRNYIVEEILARAPEHIKNQPVERWSVNGQIVGDRGPSNCPTVMGDPMRKYYPQRWEEVPTKVYDPAARLLAQDEDGIDAEVLFPNDPVQSGTFFQSDAEFELACVQAYNDGLAEWRQYSDRYIPLAVIPYLGGIESTVSEVKRSAKLGHKGIVMLAEPSMNKPELPHFNDPYWYPLWAECQDLDLVIHWHAGGGIRLSAPRWEGYTRWETQAMGVAAGFAVQAQYLPNVMFSGVLDLYPKLQWVCAETGLGWVNYILEGCDHEWERRHLWTEGLSIRPSELFQRQLWVDFWYESAGIEMRHQIGMDRIMWEADFPHSTSTYPDSWKFVEHTLKGVPTVEREQLLYKNAVGLYKLN